MLATTRGIIPAKNTCCLLLLLIAASAPLAARADDGIVDVRALPRLEGAVEDTSRTESLPREIRRSDRGRGHRRGHQETARRRRMGAISGAV